MIDAAQHHLFISFEYMSSLIYIIYKIKEIDGATAHFFVHLVLDLDSNHLKGKSKY